MGGIITKLNAALKRLFKEKGQSLTEFVLILACCAAIGWAANEVGITDAIGAVFDSGARPPEEMAAIGGGTSSVTPTPTPTPEPEPESGPEPIPVQSPTAGVGLSGFDWGKLDPNTYFEQSYEDEKVSLDGGKTHVNFETAADSQADRLAADRKALENIARHFIGMTKADVENLMTGPTAYDKNGKLITYRTADMCVSGNEELLLGHFVPGENNKGMVFLADAMLSPSEAENIFKWMKNPDDPDSVEYDSTYMYFVSDYAVSQNWITDLNAGNNQKNGLRIQIEYDYSDKDSPFANKNSVKVIGVNIALDPRSQDNDAVGTDYKEGGKIQYNRESSAGLNVQVRTDSDGTLYVTYEDTGRIYRIVNNKLQVMEYNEEGELVKGSGNNSMYKWFRDGDNEIVKKFIVDNSTHVSTPDNLAGEVTQEFKVGDTIRLCKETTDNDGVVTGYEYKYYVAVNSGTFTVSNDKIGELSGDFMQINSDQINNNSYYHDNQTPNRNGLKNGIFPKYEMKKGYLMITDKGEIYMYVGIDKKPYAGIDDTNYILLNAKNQGTSGEINFDTRKTEIQTWIATSAATIADNSYDIPLTKGDVIKSGDKYYITLNTNTYNFQNGNTVSAQAGWGNFAEFTNKYYGANDVDASGNLPTLYAGDIVVDSDGAAYVYMDKYNAGNNYAYPLATSYTNLFKLNVE